ncbi:hypothetical protein R6Q57_027750 [Mikania cordata]
MIQILFTLIFTEMALIVIFVFKTPLRKLVIMGLDRLKRGRAPIVVKAVGSTIFLVMMSSLYSVIQIRNGELTPTHQILAARHLLESSFMGFSLFLALMIDRLHHYIRELRLRRKNMEAIKKQNRVIENGNHNEVKALESEVSGLMEKITHLESLLEEKKKEASDAEVNATALKTRSQGFLLEYDRLVEDNQNLRAQLLSSDPR